MVAEKRDQQVNRQNRDSRGGRSGRFDAEDYKNPNVAERAFTKIEIWRGLAPRHR